MTDREKVIKGLEECLSASCRGFKLGVYCPMCDESWDNIRDALALLKAQEPRAVHVTAEINYRKIGNCPNCGKPINSGDYPNNCGHCGQAVKWDG